MGLAELAVIHRPTTEECLVAERSRSCGRRPGVGAGRRGGFRGIGGGSTFSPKDLGGALAGWRFDTAYVTKDGSDRVSGVLDLSGNAAHLVQATGADQPLWVAGGLNGRPVLRLAVANTEFMTATRAGDEAQPNTIYAVAKCVSKGANRAIFDSGTAAKLHELYYTITNGFPTMYAGTALTWGTDTTNGWDVWCADFNGASSNLFLDDFTTARASGTANTNVLGSDFNLGRFQSGAGHFDGDIAEVWVFSVRHTQGQRNQMRDYFNGLYALGVV